MKIFYDQKLNGAEYGVSFDDGVVEAHPDQPLRLTRIFNELANKPEYEFRQANYDRAEVLSQLRKIHSREYVDFLNEYSSSRRYASYWPQGGLGVSVGEKHRLGNFILDTFTPVDREIVQAALRSANLAIQGARDLVFTPAQNVYTMNRPSGHHAGVAFGSGHCYFNNAAVAALTINELTNSRVTILDIHFHHGNGSQQIFKNNQNIQTISIHADPNFKFPYLSGFESENVRAGDAYSNLNIPLSLTADIKDYLESLARALEQIELFEPAYLVIAFGTDIHRDDPIAGFDLGAEVFSEAAKLISRLKIPKIVTQEGGYNTERIGEFVGTFLGSLSAGQRN